MSCGSMSYQLFGLHTVRVFVERCFRTYFRFCDFFIDFGLLGASWGSSVLVELHVDGMHFYQQ